MTPNSFVPSRRSLVRSTAWAVPAVILGSVPAAMAGAAPAAAANAGQPVNVSTSWGFGCAAGVCTYTFGASVTYLDGTPASGLYVGMYICMKNASADRLGDGWGYTDGAGAYRFVFDQSTVAQMGAAGYVAGQGAAVVPISATSSTGTTTYLGSLFGLKI